MSSRELALVPGRSLAELPPDEVRRELAIVEDKLSRPAGSLAGAALRQILAAYPPQEMLDPQAFVSQAIEAIEDFPAVVVEELQDPKIGIVRQQRFVPRVSDLVKWCEVRAAEWRNAFDQAHALVAERDRAETIRRLAEETAAGAREAQIREEAAKRLQTEIRRKLRALVPAGPRRDRPGERRAREDWQAAMARALRERPDVADAYVTLLVENHDLCVWATERENSYQGSGWPSLSRRLFDLYAAQSGDHG